MDKLKDKTMRSYDALSRYAVIPYYYNVEDDKFVYGLERQLAVNGVEYVDHHLVMGDTLDSLALRYYGRPDYFWIIADFNRIQDPFEPLLKPNRTTIKIPSLGQVAFKFN